MTTRLALILLFCLEYEHFQLLGSLSLLSVQILCMHKIALRGSSVYARVCAAYVKM